MTKLEQIIDFAKTLPVEQQDGIANDLVAIMRSRNKAISLSPKEIADVKTAIADKNPIFASESEILAVLGKNF
ncbi:MAG: hypothetical protein JKY46_09020 [Robiginitomaculum sp.]|nr:hypothetical protein [Robiginitomaculum sp.]